MYEDDSVESKYWGKYKAFVRRNNDPDNRGRIRVHCPQIMGKVDGESRWLGWAEPCFPWMGGLTTGEFGPPLTREEQINAFGSEWYGVWIEFENGQIDFPIWVGTFVIAPLNTDDRALKLGVSAGDGSVGGGIIGTDLPDGSDDDAINPPGFEPDREVRLRTQIGQDIVIGSEGGGFIIIGPSGVHIVGTAVSINGATILASSVELSK